jgi:hypothetical protein
LKFADIKTSLLEKYDDLPHGWASAHLNPENKRQMIAFYEKYDRGKIPEVGGLLANYEVRLICPTAVSVLDHNTIECCSLRT